MALITYLTTIRFGFGEADALGDEIAALGIRRPMLVTDRGIVAAGLAERVTGTLGTAPVVFDATPPRPSVRRCRRGCRRLSRHFPGGLGVS
jgi:4-hydroxybutyrate dehydrogenase